MKLYIDCTNGICTDMVRDALLDLGADREYLAAQTDCLAALSHHRTYQEIKEMLETSPLDPSVRKTALAVYRVMAEAESKVHGEPVERVHFHEVGRDEAIRNIVAVAAALENVGAEQIFCSDLHDGHGTIRCSHGLIPVPVPAVQALKERCDYVFVQDDVATEMVTPGGLALLIGMGAQPAVPPAPGEILKSGIGHGTRNTGRDGLQIHLMR